jgi:hypothetical protein
VVREGPVGVGVRVEVVPRGRDRHDGNRLAVGERDRGTADHRAGVGTAVRDAGLCRDDDLARGVVEGRLRRVDERETGRRELDHQRGPDLGERAGEAGLDQVLVLVVVDVEVLEGRDLAATVSAEAVVLEVDNDAEEIRVLVEDLDRHDLGDRQLGGQLRRRAVQAPTHAVAREQHGGEAIERGEERRLTRALVELHVQQDRVDGVLRGRVSRDRDRGGVQLVIVEDRADAVTGVGACRILDLVGIVDLAAVADEDRAGQLLLEHEPHLALHPSDDVEVGDVEDVVPVELLLLVDRGRAGGPLRDAEPLLLLHRALDVALGPGLLVGDVGPEVLDPRERGLLGAVDDAPDPLGPALVEVRRGLRRPGIREEDLDVVDAVLQRVVLHGLLEGPEALGLGEDALHRVVREDVLLPVGGVLLVLLLEEVAAHRPGSFLLVVVGRVRFGSGMLGLVLRAFQRRAHHVVDDVLLLFRHAVIDGLDGLALVLGGVRGLGVGLGVGLGLLETVAAVGVLEREAGVDDRLVVEGDDVAVAVREANVVDQSAGVRTGEDEADLTDHAVRHRLRLLDQLVGVDREVLDVLVLDELASGVGLLRLVEIAVAVDAVVTILEDGMTEYVLRLVMVVLPHQRDRGLVLVLEGVGQNRPPIGALQVGLGGPPAEVGLLAVHEAAADDDVIAVGLCLRSHFEVFPLV